MYGREIKFSLDWELLARAAEQFPERAKEEIGIGLSQSAREVQRTARAKHRFRSRSGDLERAVEYTVNNDEMEADVFINDAIAPYGKWVHGGTGRHVIRARKKKFLRFVGSNGKFVFKKEVVHPGTQPDEFLHNAADASQAEVNAIFERRMNVLAKMF